MPRSQGFSSSATERKAIQLASDEELDKLRFIVRAIDSVMSSLDSRSKEFVTLVYIDQVLSPTGAMQKFSIADASYYRWRKSVLDKFTVALGKGL